MANECTPFYSDADRVTGAASAAITGCRFLKISGARVTTAGPTLNLIQVAHADAQGKVFGVSSRDTASGDPVAVIRGSKEIVPVQATNAAITAFTEVESAAGGMCQAVTTGKAVGYVVTDCAANGIAQVSLY